MIIYHYSAKTGELSGSGQADNNPLDETNQLIPTYATPAIPPATGERECAMYLDESGYAPAHCADGNWMIKPDWRNAKLWSTEDGSNVSITEPNVTPEQIGATMMPYPGLGYAWRNGQWQEDPELNYQLAEQAAKCELLLRQSLATEEINRIKPAVEGGYAKREDIERLPKLQRYLYELPDVRTKPGWPYKPQWPDLPATVI